MSTYPNWLTRLRLFVLRRSWFFHSPPVFIVGAPRTGSSFLVQALLNDAGFSGFAEGHISPLLPALNESVQRYYAKMNAMGMLAITENAISRVPQQLVQRQLGELYRRLHDVLFPRFTRWLDKTVNAESIAALPDLLAIWPDAKILYLTRDGVDNVISAQSYFDITLEVACANWAMCGKAWDETLPSLHSKSYLIIDQNRLVEEPAEVAQEVVEHLQLPRWRADRFLRNIMKFTPDWHVKRAKRAPLAELAWSPEDLQIFLNICGPQMVSQGYASHQEIYTALASSAAKLD